MALPFARIALDGEAARTGRLPTINALLRRSGCATACLYASDLLQVGDEDLRGLALVERWALLRKPAGPALLYSDHLGTQNGEAMCPRRRLPRRRLWISIPRCEPLRFSSSSCSPLPLGGARTIARSRSRSSTRSTGRSTTRRRAPRAQRCSARAYSARVAMSRGGAVQERCERDFLKRLPRAR